MHALNSVGLSYPVPVLCTCNSSASQHTFEKTHHLWFSRVECNARKPVVSGCVHHSPCSWVVVAARRRRNAANTQTTANDTTSIRSGIIGSVAAAATADEYLHCLRQWLLVLYIFFLLLSTSIRVVSMRINWAAINEVSEPLLSKVNPKPRRIYIIDCHSGLYESVVSHRTQNHTLPRRRNQQ